MKLSFQVSFHKILPHREPFSLDIIIFALNHKVLVFMLKFFPYRFSSPGLS